MLTKTEYSMEELIELTGFSRAKILRIVQKNKMKAKQVKEGRVYKHYYLAKDVGKFIIPQEENKTERMPEKSKSDLLKLKEVENQIESLNDVSEKIRQTALARHAICGAMKKALIAYEKIKISSRGEKIEGISISDTYKKFLISYPKRFPEAYKKLGDISEATLRRWLSKYDKDNPMTLIQGNQISKNRGNRILTPEQRTVFHKLALIPNAPRISQVYKKMEVIFGQKFVSYETIRNYYNKDIDPILKEKLRLGEKAFSDKYDPYVVRSYSEDSIKSNDLWVSDGHDLEFMIKNPKNGKPMAAKIVVWQDMASRMLVGCTLTQEENTEAILSALRKGIEKWGKPRALYSDNGKAYRSEKTEEIYSNLGIGVTNAIPYNAKAKPVERTFRNFKESFAVWSMGYKGGHILERPEILKKTLKYRSDSLMTWEETAEAIEQWIIWYNNQPHRGHGMENRSPFERFSKECPQEEREYPPKDVLYELFLYKEERTVGQHGITLNKQSYRWENYIMNIGQKVIVKYDYDNLRELLVYTKEGKFIDIAKPIIMANFKNSVEQIKEIRRIQKKSKKALKIYVDSLEECKTIGSTIYIEDSLNENTLQIPNNSLKNIKNKTMTVKNNTVVYEEDNKTIEVALY